jgi:hypothetical protein
MKIWHPSGFFSTKVFFVFLILVGFSANGAVITWTNLDGGNWGNTNNWRPNQLPAYNDTVLITNSGTYTVNFDLSSFDNGFPVLYSLMVSNLTLGAGTGGFGIQTLLVTNLYTTSIFAANNQLLVTNNGVLIFTNGVLSAYPLVVDKGGLFSSFNISFAGNIVVENGGTMNNVANTIAIPLTVTNGGVVNAFDGVVTRGVMPVQNYGTVFQAPLTVANKGIFDGTNVFFYGPITINSGGTMNLRGASLFFPLTNSGTINLTNAEVITYNDGTTNWQAVVVNQPNGLINFDDQSAVGGFGSAIDGSGNLINQGQIVHVTGMGYTGIVASYVTNSGAIINQSGTMLLEGAWTLLPSSSFTVGLNNASDYGNFLFVTNFSGMGGNIALAGTFNITLNNGYLPASGTTFNVLGYGSYSGNFSSLNLPTTVKWQSTYNPTDLQLIVGNGALEFTLDKLIGTNLVLSGSGGTPDNSYHILASTNLMLPLTNWTVIATDTFDINGNFQYTNSINKNMSQRYFILKPQ